MTDLLIRNIDARLKRKLAESAHRSNRSLSDEAKVLLQHALAGGIEGRQLGTLMSELLPSESRSDDYVFSLPDY